MIIIDSGYFYAAYDLENENIAPIISYMRGWNIEKIYNYCQRKGWKFLLKD